MGPCPFASLLRDKNTTMAFLIGCPNCGERNVYEFQFGGELVVRPKPDATTSEWTKYFYVRRNVAGDQREWWYHKQGCRKWFVALRDTVTNKVHDISWPHGGLS